MADEIGRGQVVSGAGCEGEVHRANDVREVMALLKHERLEDVILLTDSASATAVVPLLAKVKGIICRSGGQTSHLAIVSREFGLPAVMGADIAEPEALESRRVRVDADGTIHRA
jgi:phosphohistidine swiveling domain-containing protein